MASNKRNSPRCELQIRDIKTQQIQKFNVLYSNQRRTVWQKFKGTQKQWNMDVKN